MTPDQFVQALSQSGQAGAIFGEVRRAKALSIVLEAASVTDASGDPVDMSPQADNSEPGNAESASEELASEEPAKTGPESEESVGTSG
jgi:trigger factor